MGKVLNRHVWIIVLGVIVFIALISININLMGITYIVTGQDTVSTVGKVIGFEEEDDFTHDRNYIKRAPLIKFIDENSVARIFKGKFQYNSLYSEEECVDLIYSKDNKELVIINSYKEYLTNLLSIFILLVLILIFVVPNIGKKKYK
ncbi:MAG: hypothetical protein N4A57_09090 [Anaeromicrobium sp.]|jgi:hypothetical protein|uniref:hypothetical protein n=1 Tax=Anaeromicrobium sp. TaxID=1929132 RepID=UPI0025EC3A34|nr:hypothetical protein [Anaeromicrobium sp.]MCT4594407.1 hypothetical protein [Anaeromicrobium sp.]